MSYKIAYLDAKGLIGTDVSASLEKAKQFAEKALASKLADAVEVRDETGNLVFQLPNKSHRR